MSSWYTSPASLLALVGFVVVGLYANPALPQSTAERFEGQQQAGLFKIPVKETSLKRLLKPEETGSLAPLPGSLPVVKSVQEMQPSLKLDLDKDAVPVLLAQPLGGKPSKKGKATPLVKSLSNASGKPMLPLTSKPFGVVSSNASPNASLATVFQQNLAGEWQYLPWNEAGLPPTDVLASAWNTMTLPSNWFLHGSSTYPKASKAAPVQVDSNTVGQLKPFNPDEGFQHSGTVWFKHEFKAPERLNGALLLHLDMVDYFGEVYLNGQKLGQHEGYFQPWSVNLSPALKLGESNQLLVKVTSPDSPIDFSQRLPVGWPKSQTHVKGIFGYHDCRPGATSTRGQEQNTGGVVRGVRLQESSGVELERLWVQTTAVSEQQATLGVEVVLKNVLNVPQTGTLHLSLLPPDGNETNAITLNQPYALVAGETLRLHLPVKVEQPQLWWTWDFGAQPLYTLQVKALPDNPELQPLASTQQKKVGLRSITLGANREWLLNGKPLYFRGSNYISTQWLSQADKAWYQRDVKLAKEANLNLIRVHAHVARPEFYEVADEAGLLVWQDFPLQWGYSDSKAFHDTALSQAQDMVELLGSHPSVAVWSMHNESPHAMWWMEKKDPKQNEALDNALSAQTKALDPSRIVHRDTGTLNSHDYIGWYNGPLKGWREQWAAIKQENLPWYIEYGAQALPNKALLERMISPAALNPTHPADWDEWKFLGLQPERMFDTAGVDRGKTLDEWITNSQKYQALINKFLTERIRQHKGKPSQGVANFMLVDCWPGITWSVLDYDRVPKLAYATLKQVMQPVLPSIEYDPVDPKQPIKLWLINDTLTTHTNLTLHWQLGKEAPKTEKVEQLAATSLQAGSDLGTLAPAIVKGKPLVVWLEDGDGRWLAQNTLTADHFWLNPKEPTQHFTHQ